MTKNKVIGYCRVSTKKQAGNYSLDFQKQQIEDFCQKNNYELVKIFSETANGSALERVAFNKAIKVIKLNPDYKLLSLKPDRLSRSQSQITALIEDVLKDKLLFCNMGNNVPNSLILGMMFCMADFEKKMINERTRQGISIAKKNGVYKNNGRSKFAMRKIAKKSAVLSKIKKIKMLELLEPKLSQLSKLSIFEQIQALNSFGMTTTMGKKWTYANLWLKKKLIKEQAISGYKK